MNHNSEIIFINYFTTKTNQSTKIIKLTSLLYRIIPVRLSHKAI